jgi:hypothetical protein
MRRESAPASTSARLPGVIIVCPASGERRGGLTDPAYEELDEAESMV